jgi:hypothetical protein
MLSALWLALPPKVSRAGLRCHPAQSNALHLCRSQLIKTLSTEAAQLREPDPSAIPSDGADFNLGQLFGRNRPRPSIGVAVEGATSSPVGYSASPRSKRRQASQLTRSSSASTEIGGRKSHLSTPSVTHGAHVDNYTYTGVNSRGRAANDSSSNSPFASFPAAAPEAEQLALQQQRQQIRQQLATQLAGYRICPSPLLARALITQLTYVAVAF